MHEDPHPPRRRYRDVLRQRLDSDSDPNAPVERADMLHPLDQEIQSLRDQPALTPLDQLHLQTLTRLRALAQQLQPWDGRPFEEIPPDVQAHLDTLHEAFDQLAPWAIWCTLKKSAHPWMAPWFERYVLGPLYVPSARGRRPDSGYFSSRDEFLAALLLVMRHVHQHNPPVSRAKVARSFHLTPVGVKTSYRQLKRWLDDFGVDFDALKSTLTP
jgi:hypothetical protein